MRKGDWIALVERAYALEGTEEDWLRSVVECATPLLDHGFGVVGWTFDWRRHRFPTEILATHPDGSPHPQMAFGSRLVLGVILKRSDLEAFHRADIPLLTAADLVGGAQNLPAARYNDHGWIAKRVARHVEWEDWGIRDSQRALGVTPQGPGLGLVGPSRSVVGSDEQAARRWGCVMIHLAAGLRLRRRLEVSRDGDAVLSLDGRVHHAEGEAKTDSLREELRRAAVAVDRARGARRKEDPDAALGMWRGLVDGRWSLVDRFDRDGRHFLVARRNEPAFADPRALTARERAVLGYAAMGWSSKRIAYALGLELSTVSTHLAGATAKLGIRRAEIPHVVHVESRPVAREADLTDGEPIRVASFALSQETPTELSEAEQEVARLAMGGLSNADIASRRRSAVRTVANQLAAIYRKLGVVSRAELAARLSRATFRKPSP